MTLGNFWKDFDECQREVRASMRVVALRHDTTPNARIRIAVQSLRSAITTLEWMGEASPGEITAEDMEQLDKAASKLALLIPALRMKHSTVQLCEQFGRGQL
jgi:hypothetical protein